MGHISASDAVVGVALHEYQVCSFLTVPSALWKKGRGREPGQCTRNPPCDLWDENMLLDEMERQRQARAGGNANRPQPVRPPPPVQPPANPRQPVVQPNHANRYLDDSDADDSDEEQRPWYEGWGGPAPPVAFGMGVFGGGLPIPHRTPTPPPGYRAGSLTWMTEDPRTLLVYCILTSFQ